MMMNRPIGRGGRYRVEAARKSGWCWMLEEERAVLEAMRAGGRDDWSFSTASRLVIFHREQIGHFPPRAD